MSKPLNKIFLVHFTHKHGTDITAFSSLKRAKKVAESIKAAWYPGAKSYQDIGNFSFGEGFVEILETSLEVENE